MNPTMTLEEKKARLKSQIKLLERLKNDTKNNIENFDENNQNEMNNYSFVTTNSDDETSSTLKIKDELLKLAGLRCIKIVKDDYVFEFAVKGEDNKRINYFVQLLKVDNVIKLGKWNFPLLLDVNDIWNEIKVVDVNTLSQFLRKCKHCIDCYHRRMSQFIKFQNSMQKCGNCVVNRDGGYRCFMIELLQVNNVKTNNYMNIIVYLQYNLEEIRPFKIKVESQFDGPLPPETEKDIKPFLKPFKQLDLTDALETVEYKENHLFSWQRAERDYTLINDVDLDETSPTRKRSSSKRTGKMNKRSGNSNSKKDQSKGNQTDIAKYFKKPKSVAATKKKSQSTSKEQSEQESSSKEQSEQESSSKISTPLKKKQPKLKRLETNKNKYAKKSKTVPKQNEDHSSTELSEQNTNNGTQSIIKEKKNLQSPNSFSNETTPKKNPPQKSGGIIKSLKIQTQIQAKSTTNLSPRRNSPRKLGQLSSLSSSSSPRRNSPRKLGQLSTNSSSRRNSPRKQGQLSNSSPKKNSSSPQKVGIFKKLSPKNDASQKKKLASKLSGPLKKPSKAVQSKKLETLKKLVAPQVQITSPIPNVKLKQTSLQLTKIDKPNPRKSIINLNNSEYVLRTKIVTSTPHVERKKRLRQSLVDMNISEIKNTKKNVSKSPSKRTIKKSNKVIKK